MTSRTTRRRSPRHLGTVPLWWAKAYLRGEIAQLPEDHGLDRATAWELACWRCRRRLRIRPHRIRYRDTTKGRLGALRAG